MYFACCWTRVRVRENGGRHLSCPPSPLFVKRSSNNFPSFLFFFPATFLEGSFHWLQKLPKSEIFVHSHSYGHLVITSCKNADRQNRDACAEPCSNLPSALLTCQSELEKAEKVATCWAAAPRSSLLHPPQLRAGAASRVALHLMKKNTHASSSFITQYCC